MYTERILIKRNFSHWKENEWASNLIYQKSCVQLMTKFNAYRRHSGIFFFAKDEKKMSPRITGHLIMLSHWSVNGMCGVRARERVNQLANAHCCASSRTIMGPANSQSTVRKWTGITAAADILCFLPLFTAEYKSLIRRKFIRKHYSCMKHKICGYYASVHA